MGAQSSGVTPSPPAGPPHRPRAYGPKLKASTREKQGTLSPHALSSRHQDRLLFKESEPQEGSRPPGHGSRAPQQSHRYSLIAILATGLHPPQGRHLRVSQKSSKHQTRGPGLCFTWTPTPPPARLPEPIKKSFETPDPTPHPPPRGQMPTSALFPISVTPNHPPRAFQIYRQLYNHL